MARTQLGGKQIKDDSIESIDIKDGTIELVDLHPDLQELIGGSSEPGGTGLIDPWHHYVDKFSSESTTSDQWQTYLSLDTSDLPLGQYRIQAAYSFNLDKKNVQGEVRFILNDVDIIGMSRRNVWSGSDDIIGAADFANRTLSGVNNIKLQYRSRVLNAVEITMYNGKLESKRVTLV